MEVWDAEETPKVEEAHVPVDNELTRAADPLEADGTQLGGVDVLRAKRTATIQARAKPKMHAAFIKPGVLLQSKDKRRASTIERDGDSVTVVNDVQFDMSHVLVSCPRFIVG